MRQLTAREISRQLEPRAVAHAAAIAKLLDYSQARPNLAQVKAAGYECVFRYVCDDASEAGLPGKRLTPTERDQILNAGLDIGLHCEDNSTAAQGGYARGKAQAQVWANYASTTLRAPKGMVLVPAIDYDTSGTYPTVVQDYLGGVHDGFAGEYQVGVYGSSYVVDGAMAAHDAVTAVQAVAWSHGNISAHANVYQHGGSQFPNTDYNDVFIKPYGSWLQGGDVPLTDADATLVANKVWGTLLTQDLAGSDKGLQQAAWAWLVHTNFRVTHDVINAIADAQKAILAAGVDDATKTDLTNAVNAIKQAVTDSQTALEAAIAAGSGGPVAFDFAGTATPKTTP